MVNKRIVWYVSAAKIFFSLPMYVLEGGQMKISSQFPLWFRSVLFTDTGNQCWPYVSYNYFSSRCLCTLCDLKDSLIAIINENFTISLQRHWIRCSHMKFMDWRATKNMNLLRFQIDDNHVARTNAFEIFIKQTKYLLIALRWIASLCISYSTTLYACLVWHHVSVLVFPLLRRVTLVPVFSVYDVLFLSSHWKCIIIFAGYWRICGFSLIACASFGAQSSDAIFALKRLPCACSVFHLRFPFCLLPYCTLLH